MRKSKVIIDNDNLQESSEVLRALAHPLRMKILEFIDKHKTINVNKIYNSMKLEQSITSQHLKILRSTGIVNTERDGKFIHYSLNYPKLSSVLKAVDTFLKD
ncbi:MAG: ArsR/SmtB family transcription factor [Saprospiraceae bacterium]